MTGCLLEGGFCGLVAHEQRIERVGQSRDGSTCLIPRAWEIRKTRLTVASGEGGFLQIAVAIRNASNRKKTTTCMLWPILST